MNRWDTGWADPRVDWPVAKKDLWYPWRVPAPRLDTSWSMVVMQARRSPDWIPYGHARWVWLRLQTVVVASRAKKGSVDADMAFLAMLGQHVASCQGWCHAADPNGGRSTGERWLWRGVMAEPRLKALAVPLDGA